MVSLSVPESTWWYCLYNCGESAHYLKPSEWPHSLPSWRPSGGRRGGWAGLWSGCVQMNQSTHQEGKVRTPLSRYWCLFCSVHPSGRLPVHQRAATPRASYLSYAAQVVALEVVAWLCWKVVSRPALVRVALMILHDVLSWHGDRRQGEAGWRRHGGHVHWGHLGLEAQLVVWQLKGEAGLCS